MLFQDGLKLLFCDRLQEINCFQVGSTKFICGGKKKYPKYLDFRAPHVQTCLLSNKDRKRLVFKSCCTCTQELDFEGRVRSWTALNQKGRQISVNLSDNVENIYPTILLSKEDFLSINPSISLEEYLFF